MQDPQNPVAAAQWKRPWRLFRPILAGATLGDRMLASLGALVGIALTGLICALAAGEGSFLPLLVPPMGASAVLVFGVPASPLAQPWPAIGGNVISALVGILVARWIPEPFLAAGVAVGVAIAAMSLTRCLHPPGGAAALVAVFGGQAVADAGLWFPLVPVGLNAVVLVAAGWAFHKFSGHSYPHVPAAAPRNVHGTKDPPPVERAGVRAEDIDRTLEELGETFDISREDLARLVRQIHTRALSRIHGDLTCAQIMSRDVIYVEAKSDPSTAKALLVEHNLRLLPVLDAARVVGSVGLRELLRPAARVRDVMAEPVTALPEDSALSLVESLTGGRTHAVIIADAGRNLLGLVSQTDLLALLASGQSPGSTAPAGTNT